MAGARAQQQTGVHITTHCTAFGAETSQLTILELNGVDLNRVVVGHTAWHLMDPKHAATVMEWMKRGAGFLPTNLGIWPGQDPVAAWQPLVDAIHRVFDAGVGDKLSLGLDSGYCSESGPFSPVAFLPPDPWCHLFTHVLPTFRSLGLTEEEEHAMLVTNPKQVLPVQ